MPTNPTSCVSAALNELRPCAPLSLKNIIAHELIKGLQAVSNSLLRYNTTRMLRLNESNLFISLCRAFVEVVFPHCATCFGRSYPGGATIVMDAKSAYEGLGRILAASSSQGPSDKTSKYISTDTKNATENGVTSQPEEKEAESPNE